MKKYLLLLLPVLLAGCAKEQPVPDVYDNAQIKYTTNNVINDVILDLGAPNVTRKMNDTSTLYQWVSDNGATSSGSSTSVSNSTGFASTDCLGCGFDGDSTTVGKTSASGNVDTHVCSLVVMADNTTNKITGRKFVGTTDDKCYQHFDSIIIKDPAIVQQHNAAIEHNNSIHTRRKVGAVLAVIGGGAAVAASN